MASRKAGSRKFRLLLPPHFRLRHVTALPPSMTSLLFAATHLKNPPAAIVYLDKTLAELLELAESITTGSNS